MKKDEKELLFDLWNALAKLVFMLACFPLHVLIYGWTLATLWQWFIAPTFNLPVLPIAYALGLSLTLKLITYQRDAVRTKDPEITWKATVMREAVRWLHCLGSLGIGWLVLRVLA